MSIFAPTNSKNASVAELVDALDSKSCAFGRAGSIPARGTESLLFEVGSFFLDGDGLHFIF